MVDRHDLSRQPQIPRDASRIVDNERTHALKNAPFTETAPKRYRHAAQRQAMSLDGANRTAVVARLRGVAPPRKFPKGAQGHQCENREGQREQKPSTVASVLDRAHCKQQSTASKEGKTPRTKRALVRRLRTFRVLDAEPNAAVFRPSARQQLGGVYPGLWTRGATEEFNALVLR